MRSKWRSLLQNRHQKQFIRLPADSSEIRCPLYHNYAGNEHAAFFLMRSATKKKEIR